MTDISRFIDLVVGDDVDVREHLDAARERLEAAREIHFMRSELDLSLDKFANILGIAIEEVERIEIGDFEESGMQKLVEVNRKVQAWIDSQRSLETTYEAVSGKTHFRENVPDMRHRSLTVP